METSALDHPKSPKRETLLGFANPMLAWQIYCFATHVLPTLITLLVLDLGQLMVLSVEPTLVAGKLI